MFSICSFSDSLQGSHLSVGQRKLLFKYEPMFQAEQNAQVECRTFIHRWEGHCLHDDQNVSTK